jgi:hypothetical protein
MRVTFSSPYVVHVVIARHRPGDPVFQRRLSSSREAAANWTPRPSRGVTVERMQVRIPAARFRPSYAWFAALLEERAQGMPDAERTREPCVQKQWVARTQVVQVRRTCRHSLRDGLRLTPRSPRCPGFLATVARGNPTDLIPASGDQDHASSPSAVPAIVVRRPKRPPHPRLTLRDDRP